MKNTIYLFGFVLALAGCGGGGGGSLVNDPTTSENFKPIFIAHTAWGGNAVRSLSTEVKMRSVLARTDLQFMTFNITIPLKEMNSFSSEQRTYDISFWNSFVVVGVSGREFHPMVENSDSRDEKHVNYQHFGDIGSCVEGDTQFKGVKFINCQFLYELPEGFEIAKAYFMSNSRFIEAIVDEPL